METARVRIRNVRFKAGGATLTILPNRNDERRAKFRSEAQRISESDAHFGGWAIVILGDDGSVSTMDAAQLGRT